MLELVSVLEGHTDRVWTVSWNSSGTLLASSGADKSIRLWAQTDKSKSWVCVSILTDTHNKSIRRLSWSPCGNYLASASFDSTICIWKKSPTDQSWSTLVNLEGHESEVKSVAWSHDGNYLASCGRDRTVWIWERATNVADKAFEDEHDNYENWDCSDVKNDHTKDVKHIVWHPKHNILVSCSYDDTVKFFIKSGEDWSCCETLMAHESTVWSADFSSDGNYLVTCSEDKTIKIWKNHCPEKLPDIDTKSWKCVSVVQGYHSRSIYDVAWCKLTNAIASASGDNSIAIYNSSASESDCGDIFVCESKQSQTHDCDVNCIEWNPTKAGLLASGSDDRKIKLWKYSNDTKGTKQLTIVDELVQILPHATITETEAEISDRTGSGKYSTTKLTLTVNNHRDMLDSINTLQKLQNDVYHDEEKQAIEEKLGLRASNNVLAPVNITNLKFNESDGVIVEFYIMIENKSAEIIYEIRMVTTVNEFKLRVPKRSVKLAVVVNELFVVEKTGDLFKILIDGTCEFLLGHLFALSDIQFVLKQSKIKYIISADRDEKIRISNYPAAYQIERFCFGHKHHIRRILVIDSAAFVSIDQENEICLWDLTQLDEVSRAEKPLVPKRHWLGLDEGSSKRACF